MIIKTAALKNNDKCVCLPALLKMPVTWTHHHHHHCQLAVKSEDGSEALQQYSLVCAAQRPRQLRGRDGEDEDEEFIVRNV